MTDTISSFLQASTIRDLKTYTPLITLASTDSVQIAFELLNNKRITSAAVYDLNEKKFLGFVDTLDLCVFVVSVFAENFDRHPHLYDPKELQVRFNMPVREVINMSNRDVFSPVEASESIYFLISNFLQYAVHRVPVMENGQIVGIVSQSDVVRFLFRNAKKLNNLMTKKISELKMGSGKVISIRNDCTLMKAFSKIITNNITGLAVVNQNGKIVNNISASDLKGITLTSFYKLEIQIHEVFLYHPSKLPPVTSTGNTTLLEVLEMIEQTGVHRVFEVDEENKPIAIITLTDILRCFAHPQTV